MNCWKYANIKDGNISSDFTITVTERFGDQNSNSGTVSGDSTLKFNLTYKDICKINKGVSMNKDWAIRGPGCENYHLYRGSISSSGSYIRLGGPYYIPTQYGPSLEFEIFAFIAFDIFGCPYKDFSGKLNAYGRKAKAASGDPNASPPCPTPVHIDLLGVPPGTTNPADTILNNFTIDFQFSNDVAFSYSENNNEPYTSTGIMYTRYYVGFDPTSPEGDGYTYRNFDIEITGTRNITISGKYGE